MRAFISVWGFRMSEWMLPLFTDYRFVMIDWYSHLSNWYKRKVTKRARFLVKKIHTLFVCRPVVIIVDGVDAWPKCFSRPDYKYTTNMVVCRHSWICYKFQNTKKWIQLLHSKETLKWTIYWKCTVNVSFLHPVYNPKSKKSWDGFENFFSVCSQKLRTP